MVVLFVFLVITVVREIAGDFGCDKLTSHSCSCSDDDPDYHQSCSQLKVKVTSHKEVRLLCTNEPTALPVLSGAQNKDFDMFFIVMCPLPEMSIREMMVCTGVNKINKLQVQSCSLTDRPKLQKKHLKNLYDISKLNLSNNGLTLLQRDIFEDMGNLTWLDMKFNYIDLLDRDIFNFTPQLKVLELGRNNLTSLEPGIFKNLNKLRLLNIWGNRLLNLTRAVFSDIPNLESLDLSSNKIETIRPDIFNDLIKLKTLNLYANPFVSLPQVLLSKNVELEKFEMGGNTRSLADLPAGFFSNLSNLKTVRLSSSKLISLPEDLFYGSKKIMMLNMDGNLLQTLPEKIFMDLEVLEYLDLSHNQINNLPEKLFSKTTKLKTLKLHFNQLMEVPLKIFEKLEKLEYLDLSLNKIQRIEANQFEKLESLKRLRLSDNQLTTLADPEVKIYPIYSVLQNCKSLEELQLANNSLTEIYADWGLLLNKLRKINLAFNKLHSVEVKDFIHFNEVFIDLSNNSITSVDFSEHEIVDENYTRTRPKHIKLMNNPFNCNCQLLPFIQFVQNGLSREVQKLFDISVTNLKCHGPRHLRGSLLNHVPQDMLTCGLENNSKCPEGCICEFRLLDKGSIIKCENTNLHQIPPFLPQSQKANHSELNLQGNHLQIFKIPGDRGYENVTHFNLSNNIIENIDTSRFSNKTKVLDLSNNKLTTLPAETMSFLETTPNLERLILHGNPWQCDCSNKPFIRLLKNRFEQVKSLHNISCSDGTSLNDLDESKLCPEGINFLTILFLIVAVVFFISIILICVCNRYKTKIYIYCFSSKWKILRLLVSHPDIDVDKKYDAFISYSHEDEKFVMDYLIPQLEENGETKFKLCLHFRDWMPGESIPNQILHSVQNSRRTIVVLSPNFLESVWGKVEFRTAHCEALKDGTARVIVILYKEVGPVADLDEELRAYLQMNTYVKWGSPWFWQQLKYALPHPPEDVEDVKCIFDCFSRTNRDSRGSHEILKKVYLEDGLVHYMSDVTGKGHEKVPNMSADTKNTPLIIESVETKLKDFFT